MVEQARLDSMSKIRSFKEFSHEFDNEKIYTRRDMAEAIRKCQDEHVVNRVIQQGKDVNIAMKIIAVHKTPEGILVIVQ